MVHLRTHTNERPFICNYNNECHKAFKTKGQLEEHILTHTSNKIICWICGIIFFNKRSFQKHKNSHKIYNKNENYNSNEMILFNKEDGINKEIDILNCNYNFQNDIEELLNNEKEKINNKQNNVVKNLYEYKDKEIGFNNCQLLDDKQKKIDWFYSNSDFYKHNNLNLNNLLFNNSNMVYDDEISNKEHEYLQMDNYIYKEKSDIFRDFFAFDDNEKETHIISNNKVNDNKCLNNHLFRQDLFND